MLTPVQSAPRSLPAPAPKAKPTMVEADVRLRMAGDAAAIANGTVKLDHGFMERLVKHILRSPKRFKDIQVAFDAKTGTYKATGHVKLLGIWWPVVGRAKPTMDKNMVAFQFAELRMPLGRFSIAAPWITRKVTQVVADELNKDIRCQADPKRGLVRIDANSLLHNVGALPAFADLDNARTRFGVRMDAQGDVTVAMSDPEQPAKALPGTRESDIAVTADDAALKDALGRALAPGYNIQNVRVRQGGLTLQGDVDYKPLSEVATGVKALLIVLAGARGVGRPGADPSVTVRGPLDMDIAMDGTKLVIKPSLKPAAKQLLDSLAAAGIPASQQADGIHADMRDYLASKGFKVVDAKASPAGLEARLQIDIDSRIKNPALHDTTTA